MRRALVKRHSPLSGGLTGGMVVSALLLLVWLPLVFHHSALYGVAPDLSLHGWPLATTWAGPLGGFVLGALALGVGLGLACYSWLFNPYARRKAPWRAAYFWHATILLVVGVCLVARGLPAVSDVTISVPRHVLGYTRLPREPGAPLGQSYVTIGERSYAVPLSSARTTPGVCVSIVYGPQSMTAFSVEVSDNDPPLAYCFSRGIGP